MAKEERKRREGRVGEWVDIEKDGLPEPEDFEPWERVLVLYQEEGEEDVNEEVGLAYLDAGRWREDGGDLMEGPNGWRVAVTHWMRIPALPTVRREYEEVRVSSSW